MGALGENGSAGNEGAALLEHVRQSEIQYRALAEHQQGIRRDVNAAREELRVHREWSQRSAQAQTDAIREVRDELRALAAHVTGPMRAELKSAVEDAERRLSFREAFGAFLFRHRVVGSFVGIATTLILSIFNLIAHALTHR